MRRSAILAALAAASCVPPAPELLPLERSAGQAVSVAWNSAALPFPSKNDCDVSRFSVRIASATDYATSCLGAPEASAGCTNFSSDGSWFSSPLYPIVVISPTWKSEPGIIVHELLHAYVYCSESGKPGDPFDANHTDSRVWKAAGGESSVQARAMSLIAPSMP